MTASGELDQRVRLYSRATGTNAKGERLKEWVFVTEVWAKAVPLRGREFFDAGMQQSEITTRFRIRYRDSITEDMRLTWKGEPFDIAAPPINVNGHGEWLDLMCKSGVRDGRN